MSTSHAPLPDFENEMRTTRRLLEGVPSEKGEWKPHPKSFALGHLAQARGLDARLDRRHSVTDGARSRRGAGLQLRDDGC